MLRENSLIAVNDHDCHSLCLQVVKELAHYPAWTPLADALEGNSSVVNWFTNSPISGIRKFCFVPGHASYGPEDDQQARDFPSYLIDVIQPMILKGEIQDGSLPGSFDDRKFRLSKSVFEDHRDQALDACTLFVGPTYFQQCQRDIQRAPIEALKLMLSGLRRYADPYAYFARGLGVVVIPVTRQGHVFIGRRTRTSEYCNSLCFVSGWASFATNLGSIDLLQELERELQEEIRLEGPINWEQTHFVGLAGHPITSEVDLVFITQTDLADQHFAQGSWPEHDSWYPIRSSSEAEQLLSHGLISDCAARFDVMFSSQFALQFLINNYFAK